MALSCIVSKIKRDIGQKSLFYIPPTFDAPSPVIAIRFGTTKMKWCGWLIVKMFETVLHLIILAQYTNVTDTRRTDRHRTTAQAAIMHSIARQKHVYKGFWMAGQWSHIHNPWLIPLIRIWLFGRRHCWHIATVALITLWRQLTCMKNENKRWYM